MVTAWVLVPVTLEQPHLHLLETRKIRNSSLPLRWRANTKCVQMLRTISIRRLGLVGYPPVAILRCQFMTPNGHFREHAGLGTLRMKSDALVVVYFKIFTVSKLRIEYDPSIPTCWTDDLQKHIDLQICFLYLLYWFCKVWHFGRPLENLPILRRSTFSRPKGSWHV